MLGLSLLTRVARIASVETTTWSAAEEENRKLQVLQHHGIVSFTFGKWNSPTAVERMRYRSGFKMHQAQFGWRHMRLLLQRLAGATMNATASAVSDRFGYSSKDFAHESNGKTQ